MYKLPHDRENKQSRMGSEIGGLTVFSTATAPLAVVVHVEAGAYVPSAWAGVGARGFTMDS
jgi:hypothetical protein